MGERKAQMRSWMDYGCLFLLFHEQGVDNYNACLSTKRATSRCSIKLNCEFYPNNPRWNALLEGPKHTYTPGGMVDELNGAVTSIIISPSGLVPASSCTIPGDYYLVRAIQPCMVFEVDALASLIITLILPEIYAA
jgi:hypothetical protein